MHAPIPNDTPGANPTNQPSGGDQPRNLALRVVMMPRDTNPYGTIFGGVILSHIDQAGFVEALRHGCHRWVTASIERVDFKAPVHLGDIVNYYATTTRKGTTSVTVRVEVDAERSDTRASERVTEATITLVAVSPDGTPIDFRSAPTITTR